MAPHNGGAMSSTPLHTLRFSTPPRNGGALFASLFAGRPTQVGADQQALRFDAHWQGARADSSMESLGRLKIV